MANRIVDRFATSGQSHVYLFPIRSKAGVAYSLADWATHRVPFTERSAPNLGHYVSGNCDDTKGFSWAIFVLAGDAQPASWAVATEFADLSTAHIVDDVSRIQRAANPVVAGGPVRRNIVGGQVIDEVIQGDSP
jgi:hypothetical protein